MDLSEWAKNMKMFVSHVNIQKSVTSAETYFNNQVERMSYFVQTSQPFPLDISVIVPIGSEKSAHGDINGGDI